VVSSVLLALSDRISEGTAHAVAARVAARDDGNDSAKR
jgi:hypothetical protein